MLPVQYWADDNSNLPSNSNISKTVILNTAFTQMFFKEYLISFLIVCRFKDFAYVVFKLLIFQVCGIISVTKISFSNISGTERVNSKTEGDFEVLSEITIYNLCKPFWDIIIAPFLTFSWIHKSFVLEGGKFQNFDSLKKQKSI